MEKYCRKEIIVKICSVFFFNFYTLGHFIDDFYFLFASAQHCGENYIRVNRNNVVENR